MELKRALEIFEYNKAMLTCDMSISRDPEHQDVSPDYYGKDAEDLYYAIVCVENYIKSAIPVEWIEKQIEKALCVDSVNLFYVGDLKHLIKEWKKENVGS